MPESTENIGAATAAAAAEEQPAASDPGSVVPAAADAEVQPTENQSTGQDAKNGDGTSSHAGKESNRPINTGDDGAKSWQNMLLPIIVMVVIFYFLLIKPQRKREKAQQEMLSNLKSGDRVVTVSGIVGEVVKVSAEDVILRIDPNKDVRMRVRRAAIAGPAGSAETENAVANEGKGN